MHTEAIEDLVEEVRVVILKLDRIACALEQLTQPPTFVDQYAPYRQPMHTPGPLEHLLARDQLERGRAE